MKQEEQNNNKAPIENNNHVEQNHDETPKDNNHVEQNHDETPKDNNHVEQNHDVTPKGILTITEIKNLELIQLDEDQNTDDNCYSNASYDFRLGSEYYSPNPENRDISKSEPYLSCPYNKESSELKIQNCDKDNNVLRIRPFTSIVFSTYEIVKTPNNVAGRFDLMVKWALQGLILQVGTQIEPGYNGRLFGLLHNFSKKEICIPTGSRLLTAEFSFTINDTPPIIKQGRVKVSLTKLQQFLDYYPIIDGSLENYLIEIKRFHQEVKESVEKTKGETEKIQNAIHEKTSLKDNLRVGFWGILIALIITVPLTIMVPLIVTKSTVDKDDYPFQKVYQMETKIESDSLRYHEEVNNLRTLVISLQNKFDSIKNQKPIIGRKNENN